MRIASLILLYCGFLQLDDVHQYNVPRDRKGTASRVRGTVPGDSGDKVSRRGGDAQMRSGQK